MITEYGRYERVNSFIENVIGPILFGDLKKAMDYFKRTPEEKHIEISDRSGLSRALYPGNRELNHLERLYSRMEFDREESFRDKNGTCELLPSSYEEAPNLFAAFEREYGSFEGMENCFNMDLVVWLKEAPEMKFETWLDNL